MNNSKNCFSGVGINDCHYVDGEYTSTQEQFLKITDSALDCVREVRINVPDADGMTWTLNNKECWAKSGTENSSIDLDGCAYCQSCIFGKITFSIHSRKDWNEFCF